jgi:2-keto-3-deoxy-L-fuconate dehydrogenase
VSDAKFAGLRALVTGGASGIGLATARLLTAPGGQSSDRRSSANAPARSGSW